MLHQREGKLNTTDNEDSFTRSLVFLNRSSSKIVEDINQENNSPIAIPKIFSWKQSSFNNGTTSYSSNATPGGNVSRNGIATPSAKSIRIRSMNNSKLQLNNYAEGATASGSLQEKQQTRSMLFLSSSNSNPSTIPAPQTLSQSQVHSLLKATPPLPLQADMLNTKRSGDINFSLISNTHHNHSYQQNQQHHMIPSQNHGVKSSGWHGLYASESTSGAELPRGNSEKNIMSTSAFLIGETRANSIERGFHSVQGGTSSSSATHGLANITSSSSFRKGKYLLNSSVSVPNIMKNNHSIDQKANSSTMVGVGSRIFSNSKFDHFRSQTSILQVEKRVRWKDDDDGMLDEDADTRNQYCSSGDRFKDTLVSKSKGILRREAKETPPKSTTMPFSLSQSKPNSKIFKQLSGVTCQRVNVKKISMAKKNAILASINSKI